MRTWHYPSSTKGTLWRISSRASNNRSNHSLRGRERRAVPQGDVLMPRHATCYKFANDGRDTRELQRYLGHKDIMHTVR